MSTKPLWQILKKQRDCRCAEPATKENVMKNYRKAFILAAIGNLILLGVLAAIWWHGGHTILGIAHAGDLSVDASTPQQLDNSPASPPPAPSTTPLAPIQLSPERLQSIGVQYAVVKRMPVQDQIRVTGDVAIDETRLSYVQTRFSGYIDKVFADATYKYVRKGQPLFTIYSPELATAESEYLVAQQNAQSAAKSTVPGVAAGFESLLNASADRLNQWNIPQREIARLESSGTVQQEIEIDSPASGYITERNALPNLTVQPDTRLYTIADLSTVWVFAQVFQDDLGRVRVGEGASLTVDSYPGRTFYGRVDFIYPDVDMTTRTARVRLVFKNPNLTLTPGMFVNVTLQVPLGDRLVIPASGVLQTGTRQIAFVVRSDGYLEPRDVQLGPEAGNEYIVLSGLKTGERIISSANFLIDSESQLQAALDSFTPPSPGAGTAAAMNMPQANVELTSSPNPPRKGSNTFRVRVTGANGQAISEAQVEVTFFMPAMPAMGMSAMRVEINLADQGNGLYAGSGQLGTGGTWQVTIIARKQGQVIASKQLSLNLAGGM
jgi:membrane fusion protein, copper/silver efflux system